MGRQHQGMDRPGVRQVPEGSGEQGKMEKICCKIICDAPTALAVKGLMLMMLMMSIAKKKKRKKISLSKYACAILHYIFVLLNFYSRSFIDRNSGRRFAGKRFFTATSGGGCCFYLACEYF